MPNPPAAPRRGRPPRHSRTEILDAAAEVLVYRGYEATRYSDVAVASGVPVPSLQHYFPTVALLRREALMHKVRAELADLERQLSVIDDPWERIQAMIATSISPEPARRRGGWVLWLEYWRAAAHDTNLGRDSVEVDAAWVDVTEKCVLDGVAAGEFRLDGTAREAAVELQALLDGLGIALAVEHDENSAQAAMRLVERAARRMLHVRL